MGSSCCPGEEQIDIGERDYLSESNNILNNSRLSISNSESESAFVSSLMRHQQRNHFRNSQISLEENSLNSMQLPRGGNHIQRQNFNQIDMLFQLYLQVRGGNQQILPQDIVGFYNFLQNFQNQPVQTGLTPQQISALPRTTSNSNDSTCAVCIDCIKQGQQIILFACKHPFHVQCITQWLQRSKQCPSCRRQILIPETR